MKFHEDFDNELIKKLESLRSTSPRNPLRVQSGRMRFLDEASKYEWPVSLDAKKRHKKCSAKFSDHFLLTRREGKPVMNLLTATIVILTLVFSSGGITLVAAQNSQPDSAFYGIKLFTENVQMKLVSEPSEKVEIALNFAARRIEEMTTLVENGEIIPETTTARYQQEVEQAIQYAVNQPNDQAVQALEQVRERLNVQLQALEQINAGGLQENLRLLTQTREMTRERLQWVENGIQDPQQLRDQLREREKDQERLRTCTVTPVNPGTATPQGPGGGQPWITGTPTPGTGYGPGPGPEPSSTCTPKYWKYTQQPTDKPRQPTNAGPNPTSTTNKPTDSGPWATPTQKQYQPTQTGPWITPTPKPYQPTQPKPDPTKGFGGPN